MDASSIEPRLTGSPDGSHREDVPRAWPDWPPWTAPAALVAGIVVAAAAALLVDVPAAAFGVDVSSSHLPPGIVIADTAVQDLAFVFVSLFFAQLGGRALAAASFGLRPTRLWRGVRLALALLLSFLLLSLAWNEIFNPGKEKLLEQLGTNKNAALLIFSAALTCVLAPICEEFLFRGYVFAALRNWRGTLPAALLSGALFGAVHAGSAPAIDLVPLAVLGFGLCLLYRATGSLYPGIATHAMNNSLAFGELDGWGWWQIGVLMLAALSLLTLLGLALTRAGVLPSGARDPSSGSFTVAAGG